jgi:hypothetical protein
LAGRCSRWGGGVVVAGLGSPVAWRWCSGRCRRSRWSRCSRQRSSPAAPVRAPGSSPPAPRSRLLPLPARRGGGALLPWCVVGVPVWPRPSSARRSGGASFSIPLTALSQEKWKGKTPMGLVAWAAGSLPPPLAFEPWHRNGEAKSPSCPGLDRPGDRGGAAPSFAQAKTQGCVWRGVKVVFPRPGRIRLARERAPVPRRAGRLAGAAVPSRAPCAMRLG